MPAGGIFLSQDQRTQEETHHKEGQLSQRDFALAHQIIGYTTLVATYTGFLVLTF